jgi:hypothetical protein
VLVYRPKPGLYLRALFQDFAIEQIVCSQLSILIYSKNVAQADLRGFSCLSFALHWLPNLAGLV